MEIINCIIISIGIRKYIGWKDTNGIDLLWCIKALGI